MFARHVKFVGCPLQATAGFLVNVNQGVFYPDWWRVSLARMYLVHPDLDNLITLFFVVSRKLTKTAKVSTPVAVQFLLSLQYIFF